jgi:hypothetical protein
MQVYIQTNPMLSGLFDLFIVLPKVQLHIRELQFYFSQHILGVLILFEIWGCFKQFFSEVSIM